MKILVLAAFLVAVQAVPLKPKEPSCGYETCHPIDDSKINVHFIPHSHDDVGWLKTVDQYFYGLRSDIQLAGVQYIISSTVEALKKNPERRFIQVETAFFWMWWKQATDEEKKDFQNLVNSGQIEMINGAWSMNDEACANYQSTIDQFTWGLRILNDTLGYCGAPKIGWQIDPFGHSREQASIFKQLGFNGLFFARLHHEDKLNREANKEMDFIWQGSANLEDSVIFGNAFATDLYFPPGGLCWDITCGGADDAVVEDPESPGYNLDKKMEDFINTVKKFREYYPTNNVLIPMGGDFQYQAAENNYLNMDKFIKAFKDHDEINLIYSTPSCYLKAVNDAKPDLKLKTDDFFPYANDRHSYWAGYFSSRPNSKRFERQGHNILQAAKQISSLAKLNKLDRDYEEDLRELREAMGILQHHDAITGTEKQHVANDYVRLLSKGIKRVEEASSDILNSLLAKDGSDLNLDFRSCLLSNISICESSVYDKFVVSIYNPLSRPHSFPVRLPVQDSGYTVLGPDGKEVQADLSSPIDSFSYVKIDDQPPVAPKELVFIAEAVPALGTSIYYVQKTGQKSDMLESSEHKISSLNSIVSFDADTHMMVSLSMNGKTIDASQNFFYYTSADGDNSNVENKASGAYLFRPKPGTDVTPIGEQVKGKSLRGSVVSEYQQEFSSWAKQTVRVYQSEEIKYIEFDWIVGPIPIDDDIGKEVISRFSSEVNNERFFTDSNGREMLERTLNKKPDYDFNITSEPIAANYYPVTSKITIRDNTRRLSVLNDRSQAGSSLNMGEVELMVHRRILHDDAKGVDEALNETQFDQGVVVRGQHYVILGDDSTAAVERDVALKKLLSPWVTIADAGQSSWNEISSKLTLQSSLIKAPLPDSVNILTLEPWKDDTYILRLEHILEQSEGGKVEEINLKEVLAVTITEIKETILGANQWLDEFEKVPKFEWNVKGENRKVGGDKKSVHADDLTITLSPMQIRTFIVKLQ